MLLGDPPAIDSFSNGSKSDLQMVFKIAYPNLLQCSQWGFAADAHRAANGGYLPGEEWLFCSKSKHVNPPPGSNEFPDLKALYQLALTLPHTWIRKAI